MDLTHYRAELETQGFTIISALFNDNEIGAIASVIESADTSGVAFRRSASLFAIRQFLKEIPEVLPLLLNATFKKVIASVFGNAHYIVKSIYFDKPGESNWFVAYHQDLTIAVDQRTDTEGFGPWTIKQGQFAVQPPLQILQNSYTIRIHLDDTDQDNGALKVIPRSHLKGIYRPETIDWATENEVSCNVSKGGIMIMKPLLLHSSGRTVNNARRRVIHIEFSASQLPEPLQWAEKINLHP